MFDTLETLQFKVYDMAKSEKLFAHNEKMAEFKAESLKVRLIGLLYFSAATKPLS